VRWRRTCARLEVLMVRVRAGRDVNESWIKIPEGSIGCMAAVRHVNAWCPGGRVNFPALASLAKGFVEAGVHGVGETAKDVEGGVDRNRVKPIRDVLSRCSTILCL
jgi:hypothetical protein